MSEMLNIGRYDRDGRFTGDAWKWLMALARAHADHFVVFATMGYDKFCGLLPEGTPVAARVMEDGFYAYEFPADPRVCDSVENMCFHIDTGIEYLNIGSHGEELAELNTDDDDVWASVSLPADRRE